jgi:nucleotide-binding universal stress UspA family protein
VSGSVVVGVDGSAASRTALRWAVAEARLRNAQLVAVHAWWAIPDLEPTATPSDADWETIGRDEASARVEEFIDETLEGVLRDVEITARSVQGVTATEALVEAARDADLLVVGSRGLGRFSGTLGSVSRGCLQHADCPVVVIHGQPAQGARRLEGVA